MLCCETIANALINFFVGYSPEVNALILFHWVPGLIGDANITLTLVRFYFNFFRGKDGPANCTWVKDSRCGAQL
jgi:hypothetical protein